MQRRARQSIALQINDADGFFITNKIGNKETGKAGDYLVIDTAGNRQIIPAAKFQSEFVAIAEKIDQRITYASEILPMHYESNRVLEVAGIEFSNVTSIELTELDKGKVLNEKEITAADELPIIVYLRLKNKKDNSEYLSGAFQLVKKGELQTLNTQGKAVLAEDRMIVKKFFSDIGKTDFEIRDGE